LDILRNPTTVKLLAQQVIVACDAYLSFALTEKQLKELLFHYATHHSRKFFTLAGGLNPTVVNRIGKKRCNLVLLLLEGFRMKLM